MKLSTGYCWMLQNKVDIAQRVHVTMRRWVQRDLEDAGVEIPLNYPELEGNPKWCEQFKYLSYLCKITSPVVDESIEDSTKRVVIEDIEPYIGQSERLRKRQRTRDFCLDVIVEGRL